MRFTLAFLTLVCIAGISSVATADVPPVMNFQGVLKDGSGNPVPDGPYTVTFTIYDAPSGGTPLWTESNPLSTVDGLFGVDLGLSNPIPDSAFNNPDRWLGIQVAADPEMTPRQRLGSVAYSFRAEPWTSTGQDISRDYGNVAIGTTPTDPVKLDISYQTSVTYTLEGVRAIVINADGNARGGDFVGVSNGIGGAEGVKTEAVGSATSAQSTYGVNSRAYTMNSVSSFGVYGDGQGFGTGSAYGGYFTAMANGSGQAYGANASANGGANPGYGLNANAAGSIAYGIQTFASGSTSGYGGWFQGFGPGTSVGVFGNGDNFGLWGRGTAFGTGVYAEGGPSGGTMGVSAYSPGGWGVFAYAPGSTGVQGSGGTGGFGIGVHGVASGFGSYAGYFDGDFLATGTKSAAVKTDNGRYHLMYAQESPENWFEDFGTAQLVNGRAVVSLDRMYAQTVNTRIDYHVFLTPEGDCRGLYIGRKTAGTFEIRELQGGTSSLPVSYRVVAKRKGYENVRLPELAGPTPEERNAKADKVLAEQERQRELNHAEADRVEARRLEMEREQAARTATEHSDHK